MRKTMLASLVAAALMLPALALQAQDSYGSSANRDRTAASTDRPTANKATTSARTSSDTPSASTSTSGNATASTGTTAGSMTPPDCLDNQSSGTQSVTGITAPVSGCNEQPDPNHGQVVSQAAHDAKASGQPVGKTVREVARSDAGKRNATTGTSTSTASTDYTGMGGSSKSTTKSTSKNKQVATTKSAKDRTKRENSRNMRSEEQQKQLEQEQKDNDQY